MDARSQSDDDASRAAWVAELHAQHDAALRRFLRTCFKGNEDDLAQEIWQRVLEGKMPRDVGNPRSWLFHAAKRLGIDRVVRKRRPDGLADGDAAPIVDSNDRLPLDRLLQTERAAQTRRCLEQLTATERSLLTGRHLDGLSHGELSQQLGLNENMSAQRLSRAKVKLRGCLEAAER